MTVGYVGRSWDLNPREIDAEAGLPPPEVAGRPLTLQGIADGRGVAVEEVIGLVEDAVRTLRGQERAGRPDAANGEPDRQGPGPGGAGDAVRDAAP
jgi:hypothetical protein